MTKCTWLALKVRSHQEQTIAQKLHRSGLEEFVPLCGAGRQGPDRPMFPGYVFCRIVCTGTVPGSRLMGVPVSDREIQSIRTIVASGLPAQPWQYIHAGQTVCIRGGSLAGIRGILVRDTEMLRVVINVEPLRRSVAVAIHREMVRAVQGAAHAHLAQLYLTA